MMNSVLQNLVEQGLVDSQGIESVMPRLSEGEPLDKALVDSGLLGEAEVLRFLAGEFSVPFVDLSDFTPPPDFFKDFPIRILIKHRLLPVENGGAGVLVAVSRLFDSTGLDELRLVPMTVGIFNLPKLLGMLPVAIRAGYNRKVPPIFHQSIPGVKNVRRLFKKVKALQQEEKGKSGKG